VRNLEKHGFIEAVQVGREGRQPERTTYQITEAGRAEANDWLRELLGTPEREYTSFEAALGDAGILGPDEVTALLRQRLDTLNASNVELAADLKEIARSVPRLFLIEAEYRLAMQQAEAEWVRGLLTELTEGTLPGMDAWRKYLETGEVPPEFT
jgi:DNA-binding PadR family transcriptional regulator